jgi:molybdopterin synthase sulfur carrier subunit
LRVIVTIPAALRQYTRNASEVEVEASTVEETVQRLDEIFPGLSAFILDESMGVRRYVNIFVNEDDIRASAGLRTKLKDGDHVQIIPAIAGGS